MPIYGNWMVVRMKMVMESMNDLELQILRWVE